jgi:hypothetical protein
MSSERSALTQGVQVGVETTPGTAVAANRLLNTISIEPSMSVDMNKLRPLGQKFPSIITPGKEWVEADVSGVGSYTELIYIFSGLLAQATPTTVGGTGRQWQFNPASRAEDVVRTLTVEQGGVVRAHRFAYGLFTEAELEFTRDNVELSGSMIGMRLSDGITMTAAPTAIEEMPILPTEIDVFLDPASAGLGATKLMRALSATWSVGDRFNPVWVLNSALNSFVAHVEAEPSASATLMVEADAAGMGILAHMRAGATRFMRIAATSPIEAGTAVPHSLHLDAAVKVSDVGDFSDEDGVYAIEWTFDMVHDATWGRALRATVVNKIAAL